LLLIVSTHSSWINQINTKSCDTHQTMSFSAACKAPLFMHLSWHGWSRALSKPDSCNQF